MSHKTTNYNLWYYLFYYIEIICTKIHRLTCDLLSLELSVCSKQWFEQSTVHDYIIMHYLHN